MSSLGNLENIKNIAQAAKARKAAEAMAGNKAEQEAKEAKRKEKTQVEEELGLISEKLREAATSLSEAEAMFTSEEFDAETKAAMATELQAIKSELASLQSKQAELSARKAQSDAELGTAEALTVVDDKQSVENKENEPMMDLAEACNIFDQFDLKIMQEKNRQNVLMENVKIDIKDQKSLMRALETVLANKKGSLMNDRIRYERADERGDKPLVVDIERNKAFMFLMSNKDTQEAAAVLYLQQGLVTFEDSANFIQAMCKDNDRTAKVDNQRQLGAAVLLSTFPGSLHNESALAENVASTLEKARPELASKIYSAEYATLLQALRTQMGAESNTPEIWIVLKEDNSLLANKLARFAREIVETGYVSPDIKKESESFLKDLEKLPQRNSGGYVFGTIEESIKKLLAA